MGRPDDMMPTSSHDPHRPADDVYSLVIKAVARDFTSDGRWIRKFLTNLKRKPWSGRPLSQLNTCHHHESFPLCKDGESETTICDYWCDQFNVIDVCEGASFADTACLSTLLAETTVDTPRWTCNRHPSSRSSSPDPPSTSSSNEQSSISCCNLNKALPPLPLAPTSPEVPVQERWSNLVSLFCPERPVHGPRTGELDLVQRSSTVSSISPTRASSGIFAEVTAG